MRQYAATGCNPGASAITAVLGSAKRGSGRVIVRRDCYQDYHRYSHRFSANYQALSGHYHHFLSLRGDYIGPPVIVIR